MEPVTTTDTERSWVLDRRDDRTMTWSAAEQGNCIP